MDVPTTIEIKERLARIEERQVGEVATSVG